MPVTTPVSIVERYNDDDDHFVHVLEHLFIPALESVGFEPVPPKSRGSDVIQAEIIKQLSSCELVLCDMSILNPNVFFEFGIRTALDKPVALVADDKTEEIPFDTNVLNFHTYDSSLAPWALEEQKQKLEKHVQDAYKKSKDRNALWKYFGVRQTGTFKPEDAELGDKIDVIMTQLSAIERQQERYTSPRMSDLYPSSALAAKLDNAAAAYVIPLTRMEKKILGMILEDKSNGQIAELMSRSRRTVEAHRRRIMDKFGANNIIDLVKQAMAMGFV